MAYMDDEKRKSPLKWDGDMFKFETCYDLSIGVKVSPLHLPFDGDETDMEFYSQDLSAFIAYWMQEVYGLLNGFNGFDHIKWSVTYQPD